MPMTFEEARPPLPHRHAQVEGKTDPYSPVLRRDPPSLPPRSRPSSTCPVSVESLQASPRLSLHGLGAGPRRASAIPTVTPALGVS